MLTFYLSLITTLEEQKEFERIYHKYKALMHYIAYDILNDEQLAEDAVQNSFMKIINIFETLRFDTEQQLKSFICIVTENAAISLYRKRKHELFLNFDRKMNSDENLSPNIDDIVDSKIIAKEIFRLPDIYKDVLVLKYFNGFSNKEISNALDISEANVRKRIERAKTLLVGKQNEKLQK